ncbi:C-type lectin 37Db-like [Scaptodrosophila lebanonensis]|uniref:C-type lectin 37Db-like n=1 Tax=Drosophila lebanonensis TaxID=7225 RepID=A0A6J2T6R1_DROLE|nr:C-type lectin 37Db-like [Scaptodrosophila lebanonensis]
MRSPIALIALISVFLVGSTITHPAPEADCDMAPFVKIGEKYYFIIKDKYKLNWFMAAHDCLTMGGHLANIESAEEMDALSDYLISKGYNEDWLWVAGNDLGNNREFKSIATGKHLPFFRWSNGQPDNAGGNEHCMHLWLRDDVFRMNDWQCHQKAHAICERPIKCHCFMNTGGSGIIDVRFTHK